MKQMKLTFDKVPYTFNYIQDQKEAFIIAKKMRDSGIQNWGLDTETMKVTPHYVKRRGKMVDVSGLVPQLSKIRLIQFYDGKDTVYIFDCLTAGMHWFEELKHLSFVAHYGIFEIKHLQHAGFRDLNIGCSMLITMLIDRAERSQAEPEDAEEDEEPNTWKGYGLDATVGRLFNVRMEKKFQTSDWNTPKLSGEQIAYAALDAVYTYKICVAQLPKINEYKMQRIYKLLKDMQHVIADMELNGMHIDPTAHRELQAKWKEEETAAIKECADYFAAINLGSSKQLGTWARGRYPAEVIKEWVLTKTGQLGFGKEALATMQHLPEMAALLRYKKVAKLISTYGESLAAEVNPVTGRVHPSFTLGETRTGRLSCREPNLQNLPRDSAMRDIFTAQPGHVLLVADFNQIELRVAGELSRDAVILDAYLKGDCLHRKFAGKIYSKNPSKVTKEERQIAKSANFGTIYGMGAKKFVSYCLTNAKVVISLDTAENVIGMLWGLYVGYGRWCRAIRDRADTLGFVRTPMGRMRKLIPEEVYTKGPNTIVQGGAFEVMAVAMVELRRLLPRSMRMINSVHDEMLVECPNDPKSIKVCKDLIEACMNYGMLTVFPKATTNGLAKAYIDVSWGAAKAQD